MNTFIGKGTNLNLKLFCGYCLDFVELMAIAASFALRVINLR